MYEYTHLLSRLYTSAESKLGVDVSLVGGSGMGGMGSLGATNTTVPPPSWAQWAFLPPLPLLLPPHLASPPTPAPRPALSLPLLEDPLSHATYSVAGLVAWARLAQVSVALIVSSLDSALASLWSHTQSHPLPDSPPQDPDEAEGDRARIRLTGELVVLSLPHGQGERANDEGFAESSEELAGWMEEWLEGVFLTSILVCKTCGGCSLAQDGRCRACGDVVVVA